MKSKQTLPKALVTSALLLIASMSLVSSSRAQSDSLLINPSIGVAVGSFDGTGAWSITSLIDSRSWWAFRFRYTDATPPRSNVSWEPGYESSQPASEEATSLLFGPRLNTTHFFGGVFGGMTYFNGAAHGEADSLAVNSGGTSLIQRQPIHYAGLVPSLEIAVGPRWEFGSITLSYLQLWVPNVNVHSTTLGIEINPLAIFVGGSRKEQ